METTDDNKKQKLDEQEDEIFKLKRIIFKLTDLIDRGFKSIDAYFRLEINEAMEYKDNYHWFKFKNADELMLKLQIVLLKWFVGGSVDRWQVFDSWSIVGRNATWQDQKKYLNNKNDAERAGEKLRLFNEDIINGMFVLFTNSMDKSDIELLPLIDDFFNKPRWGFLIEKHFELLPLVDDFFKKPRWGFLIEKHLERFQSAVTHRILKLYDGGVEPIELIQESAVQLMRFIATVPTEYQRRYNFIKEIIIRDAFIRKEDYLATSVTLFELKFLIEWIFSEKLSEQAYYACELQFFTHVAPERVFFPQGMSFRKEDIFMEFQKNIAETCRPIAQKRDFQINDFDHIIKKITEVSNKFSLTTN